MKGDGLIIRLMPHLRLPLNPYQVVLRDGPILLWLVGLLNMAMTGKGGRHDWCVCDLSLSQEL
jgi:hypothetical protein